ncbi:photosystem II assembly family protein [Prochlorococcus marinus]|uniref:photosystem II assembly family protein n=1 Tax=Prochlorococcus marinus TaxID=1219 RepID=UPI0022B41BCB|nr:photosystem II assembly family protein [Prochlorococcus marinus]
MNLDPNLKKKLLQESRNPFRGIRRLTWILLMTSAGLGLLIMTVRVVSGDHVLRNDFGIQIIAFLVFATLTVFDRSKVD